MLKQFLTHFRIRAKIAKNTENAKKVKKYVDKRKYMW